MAYPAMLGRWLDCPTINLGFSGKGKMYPELVKFFTELDASVFVIDCLPNMKPHEVEERSTPMVHLLRDARPKMPIVLVDNVCDQRLLSDMDDSGRQGKNRKLQEAYERCIAEGVSNLHYVSADPILGHDWESTVDGIHPNDLGFHRMATALHAVLKPIVAKL
jgi:lysophospholipase L1-like esterase